MDDRAHSGCVAVSPDAAGRGFAIGIAQQRSCFHHPLSCIRRSTSGVQVPIALSRVEQVGHGISGLRPNKPRPQGEDEYDAEWSEDVESACGAADLSGI